MTVYIVRLGSERIKNEGTRIGTVRRPPRGVPKSEFASQNWYDVWLPNLAPAADTVKSAKLAQSNLTQNKLAQSDREWWKFVKKYRSEMAKPDCARVIATLAALSHHANFSVGCYCEDETRCHRSVLRALLAEHGAQIV